MTKLNEKLLQNTYWLNGYTATAIHIFQVTDGGENETTLCGRSIPYGTKEVFDTDAPISCKRCAKKLKEARELV